MSLNEMKEVSPGIFYSDQAFVMADRRLISFLKDAAGRTPTRRARLCAHPSPQADQHDMVIASHHDTYVAPHRHHAKSESFVVLEGAADVLLFDEQGALTEVIAMGDLTSGLPFFYRMPPRTFHSLIIRSDLLVFVESTKGPFRPEDSENAAWAPPPDRPEQGKKFLADLVSAR